MNNNTTTDEQNQYSDQVLALAKFLGVDPEEITESRYDSNTYQYGREEYLVVDDSKADELWDESLDSYLEECVLPDLPDFARRYFDREAWKEDARHDGRGHCLASYDGHEHEISISSMEYWYIYRIN